MTGKTQKILIVALLIIGIARTLLVALNWPILGYANQYDMIRVQACSQIWPVKEEFYRQASRAAPLELYRLDEVDDGKGCLLSSELLFTAPVAALGRAFGARDIDLRWFGFARAVALIAVAGAISLYFWRKKDGRAAALNAAFFAAILADPANTLYLNGFYQEFSAFLFLYTSFALLYIVCKHKPGWMAFALFGVSLALLGLSKTQHILAPLIILGLWMAFGLRQRWQRPAQLVLPAVLALAGLVGQVWSIRTPAMRALSEANAVHIYFGVMIPFSSNPAATAQALGLPPVCAQVAMDRYLYGKFDQDACPQVLDVPQWRSLVAIAKDPTIFFKMTQDGIVMQRPWVQNPQYLGQVSGQVLRSALPYAPSLGPITDLVPLDIWRILFFVPLLAIGFMLAAFFAPRLARWRLAALLVGACAVCLYADFYSSIFGAGVSDFAKHSHLGYELYALMLLFGVGAVLSKKIHGEK